MSSLINIRSYNQEDKIQVLHLLELNTPDFFAPEEETDFISYLKHEIEYYYVVEIENAIVGCGGINLVDNGSTGRISWDIIHPRHQGKSIGTKLTQHRVEKLRTIDSVQRIRVRTSQVAYQFYEKQGFVLLEVLKDYWAKGFDMYNMEYRQT